MQTYYGCAVVRAPAQSRRVTLLPAVADYLSVINTLRLQLTVNELVERNKKTALRIEQLEETVRTSRDLYEELRDVSVEQAAQEIRELFNKSPGRDIYYSDLAQELKIDVATIMEACDSLVDGGVIEAANG
jgi:hypothetical protein